MNLTVCASATDDALASLEDIKDALGITDSLHNETLRRFIRRASRRIESHLGRTLGVQVYQAVLPAYGRRRLRLPSYPVRAILRAYDGTDTGTAAELQSTEYTLDKEAGFIERNEGFAWTYQTRREVVPFPEPGQEYGNYLVEFSAGYILPAGKDSTEDGTTTTGVTLDQDLQDACIALVRNAWHSRSQASNVSSKRVGEISITYADNSRELPADVLAILSPYRSVG